MADSVISTFDKGLHQDSAFILQPDGTYRNAKNGMLISNDGNHYTLEMSNGNRVILELPQRYLAVNNAGGTLKDTIPAPIGFSSFIDKLAVFFTNEDSETGNYGEIGLISFNRVLDDFQATYTPYYFHQGLNFTKFHRIESFSFAENDETQRTYWTDYNNEPRVFDFGNPIFTTYFNSGTLVTGKRYMVLGGVILHNTFRYGPSNGTNIPTAPNYVNDNVFTAANANFTVVSGTPLVIEYYPIELLDWTPNRLLGEMKFDGYNTGSVHCGNKMYFYRLISNSGGIATTWSYGSDIVPVITNNNLSASVAQGNNYHNLAGNGTDTTITDSGKSVIIDVYDIDTAFDIIELACAEFDQKTDIIYSLSIVDRRTISGDSIEMEHTGSVSYGTLLDTDITLFPASVLKIKTLATNKNYNIIGNITEREELDIDVSAATLASFEYPLIAHGDLDLCINNLTYDPLAPALGANPGAGDILPWSRYLVTFGNLTTDTVEYPPGSGDYYITGEVVTGVVGAPSIAFVGSPTVRPCVTRNRYTVTNPSSADVGKRREDATEIKTVSWDYKDPAVAANARGYWSNEKYRLAFVGYDKKGQPFYARWLGDIIMPDIDSKGGLILKDACTTGLNLFSYSLNPSGINVSNLLIPSDIMDKLSGFSIMRAERDVRIVTQGLLVPSIEFAGHYPAANLLRSDNKFGLSGDNYAFYMSPDFLTESSFKVPINVGGDRVEAAEWLDPYYYNVFGAYVRSNVLPNTTVSKLFTHVAKDSTIGTSKELESVSGKFINDFNENDNLTLDGTIFINQTFGSFLGPLTERFTCSGSFDARVPNSGAVGCKKSLLKFPMFLAYSSASTYTDNAGPDIPTKLLVNYVKSKSQASQYGGIGESSLANTLYISTGHYQPINSQVKSDTDLGTGFHKFDNIEVFGGDCFVNIVDLAYSIYSPLISPPSGTVDNEISNTIYFPCESNCNYNLRRGRTPSRQGCLPDPYVDGIDYNTPRLEDFSYNKGYSSDGEQFTYSALPAFNRFTTNFRYTLRWAGLKIPGELIDSFRTFRIGDTRNLDANSGQVNNLKVKDGNLFYWQDHGTGYTPILERQLVGGTALGTATALGVTGVIDRYDVIDTYFGNQHQFSLTETEYGFAWFDMRKRALLTMVGNNPTEISLTKGLQVFFNNEFNEGATPYIYGIYNTNDSYKPEIPLLGFGITSVYDPKFKMTYVTFKYQKNNVGRFGEVFQKESKDFTVGYSHVLNAVVGFYDHNPAIWHNHNDLLLSANNPKFTRFLGDGMQPPVSFIIGDVVALSGKEYVCIKEISYVVDYSSIPANELPDYPESIYWKKINSQNQIYIQTFGADICKFYGKVFNHELEVIVNPKTDIAKTLQNIQMKAVGPNFTDIYCGTDTQTSQDVNITSTNRNYKYTQGAWFSSVPVPSRNGKLTDYYFKIKFVFKNYVTDPTVSKNVQKISQWLKSMFATKR